MIHKFVPSAIWLITHVKFRTKAKQVTENLIWVAVCARWSLKELTCLKIVDGASFLNGYISIYHYRWTFPIKLLILCSFFLDNLKLLKKSSSWANIHYSVRHPIDWEKITKASAKVFTINDCFFIAVDCPWRNFLIWGSHCIDIHVIREVLEHRTCLACFNINYHLLIHAMCVHILECVHQLICVEERERMLLIWSWECQNSWSSVIDKEEEYIVFDCTTQHFATSCAFLVSHHNRHESICIYLFAWIIYWVWIIHIITAWLIENFAWEWVLLMISDVITSEEDDVV